MGNKQTRREDHANRMTKAATTKPATNIPDIPYEMFFKEALHRVNQYRNYHQVKPLTLNAKDGKLAMEDAATIASTFEREKCPNAISRSEEGVRKEVGQNVYASTLWSSTNPITLQELNDQILFGIDHWYGEVLSAPYDFAAPENSLKNPDGNTQSQNFTQLVWAGSSSVAFGVSIAKCGNGSWIVLVANFKKPGNVPGTFADNVFIGYANPITG